MFETFSTYLTSNQFFSGGFALTVFGGIVAALYRIPSLLWPIFKRQFVSQLDFSNNEDMAFKWVEAWIAHQPYVKHSRHMRVAVRRESEPSEVIGGVRPSKPEPLFLIPEGLHWFWYKNRLVWVIFTRTRMTAAKSPSFSEDISICSFLAPKDFLLDIVKEAQALYEDKDLLNISIFAPANWGDSWKLLTKKPKRPLTSLVFDDELGSKVFDDIQFFLANREWYVQMDIPWKRGYLFYGQPGTGKTSLITALAGELGKDIYTLNLSKPDLSDDDLLAFMSTVPAGDFILIEEVDCLFQGRESKTEKQLITFGGLLTALDGIASTEGRILFMTTNHKEKLDTALIRAGRADLHLEFLGASHSQIARLVVRFFPEYTTEAVLETISPKVKDRCHPMAAVQEALLAHRNSYEGAINALLALD